MAQENQTVACNPIAEVLDSTTLPLSDSRQEKIKAKRKEVIANIPVVVSEPKIQINVESTIRLEDLALEFKDIRKSLCLTQCELIPTDDKKVGKLFISGFVRKNIEYATVATTRNGVVSGAIRHTTVSVPFNCFARVELFEEVEFEPNVNAVQVQILDERFMCADPLVTDNIQTQRFNRRVFCELVEAKFREKDIIQNLRPLSQQSPDVLVFDTFVEKMVIDVVIKIQQVQQVEIGHKHHYDCKDDFDWKDRKDDKCDCEKKHDKCDWDRKDCWEKGRYNAKAGCWRP